MNKNLGQIDSSKKCEVLCFPSLKGLEKNHRRLVDILAENETTEMYMAAAEQ